LENGIGGKIGERRFLSGCKNGFGENSDNLVGGIWGEVNHRKTGWVVIFFGSTFVRVEMCGHRKFAFRNRMEIKLSEAKDSSSASSSCDISAVVKDVTNKKQTLANAMGK
jgi:hypothetical protein